jgi:REP element-mobilizing transposase RayT
MVVERYARRFEVKVIQISIQEDHLHLHIRATKRGQYQSFFRVVTGQIAQILKEKNCLRTMKCADQKSRKQGTNLWRQRPFTRVVRGRRDFQNVQDYVRLNEKEVLGEIPYRKERLKGLTSEERKQLWHDGPVRRGDRYPWSDSS